MPQTREHVLLARQIGVPKLAVVINNFGNTDNDILELIKEDVTDLLSKNGYDKNAPVFVIDAFHAADGVEKDVQDVKDMMAKIDEYFEMPEREVDKPFLMGIEDVFSITGRGTVVTGRVDRGTIKVNEEVELVGLGHKPVKTTATGLEMFRKSLDSVVAGDNVGILVRGIERKDVERGMVLAKTGSVTMHTEFKAEVYVLKKEEGGRHTAFVSGYRPQFYIRTADVTGEVTLDEGTEMITPGENAKLNVKLIVPVVVEKGMRFAVREGGITVGAGVVTDIIK
jgi:elongation factor Tu